MDFNERRLNRFLNRCLLQAINRLLLTAIIDMDLINYLLGICRSRLGFPHAHGNGQFDIASSQPNPLTHSSPAPPDTDTLLLERSFVILRLHR
jgi:hypothetical protein